jgi:hypothetical protein
VDSSHLIRKGFGAWMPFNRLGERALLVAAPPGHGVYCIRVRGPRVALGAGHSDIIYIGSAANRQGLRTRLRQYFHPGPTQWTNRRLLARCGDSDHYEAAFVLSDSPAAAKCLEAELLHSFQREHGQLPEENKILPPLCPELTVMKSKAERMLEAVGAAPMSRRTRVTLERFVQSGDAEGMLRYLERCLVTQRDVGRSIRQAGHVSFESRMPEVRRIYGGS